MGISKQVTKWDIGLTTYDEYNDMGCKQKKRTQILSQIAYKVDLW